MARCWNKPLPRDMWLPYPLPPLSLNMLFALCAPLSFSVRLAAEISGMMPASGQRPRCGLLGAAEAKEAEVGGGIPQSRSVSADLAGGGISCTSGSFLPLALDWKCQVGV